MGTLTVLLVIQIIIATSLVVVVLLQRSSSDGLGGLGGGGGNSLMSGRAQANLLTKATSLLAVGFMVNSLLMATITARSSGIAETIIEGIQNNTDENQVLSDEEPSVPIAE